MLGAFVYVEPKLLTDHAARFHGAPFARAILRLSMTFLGAFCVHQPVCKVYLDPGGSPTSTMAWLADSRRKHRGAVEARLAPLLTLRLQP